MRKMPIRAGPGEFRALTCWGLTVTRRGRQYHRPRSADEALSLGCAAVTRAGRRRTLGRPARGYLTGTDLSAGT